MYVVASSLHHTTIERVNNRHPYYGEEYCHMQLELKREVSVG